MIMNVTAKRYRGKALTQQQIQQAVPVCGDLVVIHVLSEEFGRYSNVARFQLSGATDPQPLPELHDATLSWMGPLGFVLTGFEVIGGVTFGQSWWCRAPS